MTTTLEQLCRELEHFETPDWAVDTILDHVKLCGRVHDPCTGTGVLATAVKSKLGRITDASDIYDWGYPGTEVYNYLERTKPYEHTTSVIMNPPFSYACQFVQKAFALGAVKVLCFQRKAWRESLKRRNFWATFPPTNIFVCGERATCWRHDISQAEREARGGTPTPHAWYEFDFGYPGPVHEHIIYKDGGLV
jgi:predicted RNA methylase